MSAAPLNVYVAEALGTMVFVLAILCVVNRSGDDNKIVAGSIPIYIGLALVVSIYLAQGLGGNGHLNPAVSIALASNNTISVNDLVGHILAQCVGALIAFFVYKGVINLPN